MLLKKTMTALISTVIFSVLMGVMNYVTATVKTGDTFWVPTLFFAMYAAPVYLVGGLPTSYLIDRIIMRIEFNSQLTRHYAKYSLYILAGAMIALIYTFILAFTEGTPLFAEGFMTYMVGGVIAALIFYYVSMLFEKKPTK